MRNINTVFELQNESPGGGRIGKIRFGGMGIIETPAFFPALCIMTGPPGFGRNGAHYKYIKRILCRDKEWRHESFLSEILHFTDYLHSDDSLKRWLKKPFQSWMDEMMIGGDQYSDDNQGSTEDFEYHRKEKPYEACFFLDSGGFKLLSNMDFSIEKYGYPTTAESILDLQTKMGGDIIASLDFPLPSVEYSAKALKELQNKSIKNGVELLKILSTRGNSEAKPLAYLAIHGVDYKSAFNCTKSLLTKIDNLSVKYESFGFAIGSLVPRRSNRALVASIVKGVKDSIYKHRNGLYINKPIHAFGMSNDIVPTLAFLGVDTFDSNSFVQTGKNLNYIPHYNPGHSNKTRPKSLRELSKYDLEQCNCRACKAYTPLIEVFKELSKMEAQKRHEIEGVGRKLIKSEVYAFLALHALEGELRQVKKIKDEIEKSRLKSFVLEYAKLTNNHGALLKAYEAAIGEEVERPKTRKVSIELTRDSFSVPETYCPPKEKEILLFIPCTKEKPYKSSRSHEAIYNSLYKDNRIHIVTISGLYGPVPEEYEEEPEILEYDYILSSQARTQADFIADRILTYLKRYEKSYRQIIVYATAKAYRAVGQKALKLHGRGILLPAKLKERTSKEFLKHENLQELKDVVKSHLEGRSKV